MCLTEQVHSQQFGSGPVEYLQGHTDVHAQADT